VTGRSGDKIAGLKTEKLQDLQFAPEVEQDFISLHFDLHQMTDCG